MSERRLETREAIEAYISKNGFICLKQEDFYDEESIIMMTPQDVPIIIQWLQELLVDREDWKPEPETTTES